MANEAVEVEGKSKAYDFTVADGDAITKGKLLWYLDPRTISGGIVNKGSEQPFAGIASVDKVADDGAINISCWQDGIWDLVAAEVIPFGSKVTMSGLNTVVRGLSTHLMSGSNIVGTALETSSTDERIEVDIGNR